MKRKGLLIRADPSYRSEKPWFDWVSSLFVHMGECISQVLFIFSIELETNVSSTTVHNIEIEVGSLYAVVSCSNEKIRQMETCPHCVLFEKATIDKSLFILQVDSINYPELVIPNVDDYFDDADDLFSLMENVLRMRHCNEWADEFIKGDWNMFLKESK